MQSFQVRNARPHAGFRPERGHLSDEDGLWPDCRNKSWAAGFLRNGEDAVEEIEVKEYIK
jgi:hypothetical protein